MQRAWPARRQQAANNRLDLDTSCAVHSHKVSAPCLCLWLTLCCGAEAMQRPFPTWLCIVSDEAFVNGQQLALRIHSSAVAACHGAAALFRFRCSFAFPVTVVCCDADQALQILSLAWLSGLKRVFGSADGVVIECARWNKLSQQHEYHDISLPVSFCVCALRLVSK